MLYWSHVSSHLGQLRQIVNHSKPECTIVIFIHYKPRIAAAILVL